MFTSGRKSSNRLTFISIIMILAVIYIIRLISPQKEAAFPDTIQYDNHRYAYVEIIKGSPTTFSRKRPASEEGYMVLTLRGISTEEEIYIYEGFRKYRRYVILKE
jgi:hypothetical protein